MGEKHLDGVNLISLDADKKRITIDLEIAYCNDIRIAIERALKSKETPLDRNILNLLCASLSIEISNALKSWPPEEVVWFMKTPPEKRWELLASVEQS